MLSLYTDQVTTRMIDEITGDSSLQTWARTTTGVTNFQFDDADPWKTILVTEAPTEDDIISAELFRHPLHILVGYPSMTFVRDSGDCIDHQLTYQVYAFCNMLPHVDEIQRFADLLIKAICDDPDYRVNDVGFSYNTDQWDKIIAAKLTVVVDRRLTGI